MPSPTSNKSRSPTAQSPAGPQSPAGLDRVAEEQGVIEVDNDSDSSYSKSTGITDTESLRSSIMAFKWENGRRYHAYQEGAYWAPNDDRQQEAEDLMHEVYRIILNDELYEAPIGDSPQKVLDVGCGTGIWAIEFADQHPSADVLGVDLSPIQPNFVPPNCRFEVDDITSEWTYPDNTFDFIHVRAMIGCIPDWTELYRKAFKHMKPGGWLESVELWGASKCDDDTLKDDSPLFKWVEVFKKIEAITGKSFFWDDKMGQSIIDAGFTNVSGRKIKLPIGTWPKDKRLKHLGAWNRHFLLQGLEGFSIRGLTEMLGWKYEDAQLFLAAMRKELTNPALHAYLEVLTLYAGVTVHMACSACLYHEDATSPGVYMKTGQINHIAHIIYFNTMSYPDIVSVNITFRANGPIALLPEEKMTILHQHFGGRNIRHQYYSSTGELIITIVKGWEDIDNLTDELSGILDKINVSEDWQSYEVTRTTSYEKRVLLFCEYRVY
ncbi:hypothetical protein F53441_9426 [Fusarium austroafricanum]|uniref:Methyltransferase domain-containing protein n=1 Tax=Fusarium austroafricanum TaxID=2364996 RepID=A0A8H4NTA8_9HYPO|nr:hypothetical protein F53441_9426 [Fusarium austroafricanum]